MARAMAGLARPLCLALLIATCEKPMPSPSLASEPAKSIASSRGDFSITRKITQVIGKSRTNVIRTNYNRSYRMPGYGTRHFNQNRANQAEVVAGEVCQNDRH